jgi:4-diphosphocytidyl-2-C-methyl-D-erythritol kinase
LFEYFVKGDANVVLSTRGIRRVLSCNSGYANWVKNVFLRKLRITPFTLGQAKYVDNHAMTRSLHDLPAPAKINWFLHIVGRHASGAHAGKHQLQSLMQLIDLQDTLHVEVTDSAKIQRRDEGDTPADMPADDLCVRAARALQAHSSVKQGCMITLHKRVPSGAGLGGGSSDAATTLLALNKLWGCGLSEADLAALALGLGADIPFFLQQGPAWVEGIGEVLRPVKVEALPLVLIKPACAVSTAAVYQHAALKRDTPEMIMPVTAIYARNDIFTLMSITNNDLQNIAELIAPQVSLAIELARAHAINKTLARMSGSGSAVFAVADDVPAQAQPMIALPEGWRALRVNTLAVHPLFDRLK